MNAVWQKGKQGEINYQLLFRKFVEKADYIEIAASNLYRVFVDGKLLHYGPARAAHHYCRLDRLELGQFCNFYITVEVLSYQVSNYYTNCEFPFFGAQVYLNGEIVVQAKDFDAFFPTDRIQSVLRASFQRGFVEEYDMQRCRTEFYSGKNIFPRVETEQVSCNSILERNVDYPLLDEVCADFPCECGKTSDDRADLPLTKRIETLSYQKTAEISQDLSAGLYAVYDLERTHTGFIRLKIEAEEDSDLIVIFDEIDFQEKKKCDHLNIVYNRNSYIAAVRYLCKKGKYDLISFEAGTGRYFKIICLKGRVSVEKFSFINYENPSVRALKFICEDKRIEKIVRAAQNTLAQNSVDIFMDCPSRERAGWLCDSYFSAKAEKILFGSNKIEHNFLENYALCPQLPSLPEGMIPMCYPGDHENENYIPNWAMFYMQEIYDYFLRTGKRDLVRTSKKKVYGLIRFFENYFNEYGLLEDLDKWVFVDWSEANNKSFVAGVNFPTNMLYADCLRKMGELYKDKALTEKSYAMKKQILRLSYNGQFFEDNLIRNRKGELVSLRQISEACQYYAFYFGTADKNTHRDLLELLVEKFGPKRDVKRVFPKVFKCNALVGNYLRWLYLIENDYENAVYDECIDYFFNMAERTGTLWEHDRPEASLNHGFASVAANIVLYLCCGYKGVDFKKKKAYFQKPCKSINFRLELRGEGVKFFAEENQGKIKYYFKSE